MSERTAPTDVGQANLELAESLREVAAWLEMHAGDLPPIRATAWVGEFRQRDARAELTALATALGKRATEAQKNADEVQISGEFGSVTIFANAKARELAEDPPPPVSPIIPVSDAEGEAWRARGWRESPDRDDGKPLTEAQMFEGAGVPSGLAVHADEIARRRPGGER